jgi:hypothetical protein
MAPTTTINKGGGGGQHCLKETHIHLKKAPWISNPPSVVIDALRESNSKFQVPSRLANAPMKYDEFSVKVDRMPEGLTPEQFITNIAKRSSS